MLPVDGRVMDGPAADGVVRDQLSDDTLVVFLSDTHIGGPADSDISTLRRSLWRCCET